MEPFTHDGLPGRVVFGAGAVDRVAAELEGPLGGRALIIAGGSAIPIGDRLAAQLSDRLAGRLARVAQHVPQELADEGRLFAESCAAEVIISVGGGSAIGLGKAIAVDRDVPLVCVPTTYSGSEMTPFYGLTGQHKHTARDLRALPRLVIYDPELTTGLPAGVTASSGLNAIAHCVEAFYAPGTSPVVELMAEEGIRALARSLASCVATPSDAAARGDALYGAYLAGAALAVGGTALQHKLAHALGGTYGLNHADTHAVILPHVTAFNAPAVPGGVARVAAALGGPADSSAAGGLLHDLAVTTGAPTSLEAIGLPEAGLRETAERVAAEVGTTNPRPADADAVHDLLLDAWAGRRP
jgi:maleylacetate reductase